MSLSLNDYQSDAGLAGWVSEIGCTDAVIPRRNIKVALEFFATQMPELSLADAVSFLAAMDLSKPVNRVYLRPGDRVIGWRTATESPFKLFFARRGQSPQRSGINSAGRGPVHFAVKTTVLALESFTAGAIDTWTPRPRGGEGELRSPRARKWFGEERDFGVMAMAGGQQLIIPSSYSHMLIEQR
jgi:hypothetical protein